MKFVKPVLSAEQSRVMDAYRAVITPATFAAMAMIFVLLILVDNFLNPFRTSFFSPGGQGILIPLASIACAHVWAVRKVRMSELSLESTRVEVIDRVNSDFDGKVTEWKHPKPFLTRFGDAAAVLLFAAFGWWLWHSPTSSSFLKATGIFAFCINLWQGTTGLIFFRLLRVRIDNDGIANCSTLWKRRARWADVAECEIRSFHNFLGEGPTRTFVFQGTGGKVLLRLTPRLLRGLSRDEQAEIEREIKRRFGHTEPHHHSDQTG